MEQVRELTDEELKELLSPKSDYDWRSYIDADPAYLGGKPKIKGTRISVDLLLDWLAAGWTEEMILNAYPFLSKDAVRAGWAFAAETLRTELGKATGIAQDRAE